MMTEHISDNGTFAQEDENESNMESRYELNQEYVESDDDCMEVCTWRDSERKKRYKAGKTRRIVNYDETPLFCDYMSLSCFYNGHNCTQMGWQNKRPLPVCYKDCKIQNCNFIIHIPIQAYFKYHKYGLLRELYLSRFCEKVNWCINHIKDKCKNRKKCKKTHIKIKVLYLTKII